MDSQSDDVAPRQAEESACLGRKLAFLVYDSRSGSTLIARRLAEWCPRLWVTPEVGLSFLLSRTARGDWKTWRAALRNLVGDPVALDRLVDSLFADPNPANAIRRILERGFRETHDGSSSHANIFLIKYGPHIMQWRELVDCFGPDTKFVFVVRDPRATISSKLRTVRPYFPYETMAWGGVLLAAIRWRAYVLAILAARESGVQVKFIRFEDFLANPQTQTVAIAEFLGTSVAEAPNIGVYKIPVSEQAIHSRVLRDSIDSSRLTSWIDELSARQIAVIEAVCGDSFRDLGYVPQMGERRLYAFLSLIASGVESVFLVGIHLVRKGLWSLRGPRHASHADAKAGSEDAR